MPLAATTCTKCGEGDPVSHGRCRGCLNAYHRDWRKANAERHKESVHKYQQSEKGKASRKERHLQAKFGITTEEWESMYTRQSGACPICTEKLDRSDRVCVDHDHDTGVVRGLLHVKCNAALGGFGDDFITVQRAALYLSRTKNPLIHPWAVIGEPPEHREWNANPGPYFYPKISSTARIHAFVTVDSGLKAPTFVGANAFLMAHVHVGHDATICHECELAPGVVIGGHCWVGGRVKIGVGAVLRPYINVGPGARIGAGAVVVKDVAPNMVVAGNPAKVLA